MSVPVQSDGLFEAPEGDSPVLPDGLAAESPMSFRTDRLMPEHLRSRAPNLRVTYKEHNLWYGFLSP